MSALEELLAKVEAATGPDRDLDASIYIETMIPKDRIGRVDRLGGVVGWHPRDAPYQSALEVPSYTASIDAAVALVEKVLPGAPWQLCSMPKFGSVRGMPWARIGAGEQAFGRTPVLALLSALLRALPSPVHPQGS